MPKMSELWDKMNEGDEVKIISKGRCSGDIATKQINSLVWQEEQDLRVSTDLILNEDWELVKEEEKGIETERWERNHAHIDKAILYKASHGVSYTPSEVMDRKAFLRWVGKIPKPEGEVWPGHMWCLWFDEDGIWHYNCNPEDGYTKQVFADYAEMRVEK